MNGTTIFALSSGSAPSAIAVIRVSGGAAGGALSALTNGRIPPPRRASLRRLRDPGTDVTLDHALVLWFPGPETATGEDLVELHLHGGRAVIAAVESALSRQPSLRRAWPGEFTRRALENGRIDLSAAEGLADLLEAETELQRRQALAIAEGGVARLMGQWRRALLDLSAMVEAAIEFSDDGEVTLDMSCSVQLRIETLISEFDDTLARPSAERLRDGVRVVIAGPPNAGKSTLLNAIVAREAAITSPLAGTTRDIVEVPVTIGGVPFILSDTAGLRDTHDAVEKIGVDRARAAAMAADILLWLGKPDQSPDPERTIQILPKSDVIEYSEGQIGVRVSAQTRAGLPQLLAAIEAFVSRESPQPGAVALSARYRATLGEMVGALRLATMTKDIVIVAELLRSARTAIDRTLGGSDTEAVLDHLFGRFCIGK